MPTLERDPDGEDDLVSWWDFDDGLENDTQLTVEADEVAIFWADDEALLQLGAGRHLLTGDDHPALADYISDDEAAALQVAFVRVSNYSLAFDGELGDLVDQETGLACTYSASCGEVAVRVTDPITVLRENLQFDEQGGFEAQLSDQLRELTREALARNPPSARLVVAEENDEGFEVETAGVEAQVNARLASSGVAVAFEEPLWVFMGETDAATVRKYLSDLEKLGRS